MAEFRVVVVRDEGFINSMFVGEKGVKSGLVRRWMLGQQELMFNAMRHSLGEFLTEKDAVRFVAVESGVFGDMVYQKDRLLAFLDSDPKVHGFNKGNRLGLQLMRSLKCASMREYLGRCGISVELEVKA